MGFLGFQCHEHGEDVTFDRDCTLRGGRRAVVDTGMQADRRDARLAIAL